MRVLNLTTVFLLLTATFANPVIQLKDYANGPSYDYSAWMGQMSHVLYPKRLTDIILPGTHDSGAYRLDDAFSPEAELSPQLQKIINLAKTLHIEFPYDLIRNWALAQSMDFYQQLTQGIRFFDLRAVFDVNTNAWRTCHMIMGDQIDYILEQVGMFVRNHPSEVVVIQVSHYAGSRGDDDMTVLANIIEARLGEFLYPRRNSFDFTVGDMVSSGKRVLVTVTDWRLVTEHAGFWYDGYVYEGEYADSSVLATMESHNEDQIKSYGGEGRLFQMFYTLTAQVSDIEAGILESGSHPNTLLKLAMIANADFDRFINEQKKSHFVANLLMVDHFDRTNLVEVVKELNLRLDACNDKYLAPSNGCRAWAANCTNPSDTFVKSNCPLTCGTCPDLKGTPGSVCHQDSDCIDNICTPDVYGHFSYCLVSAPLQSGESCGQDSQCWSGKCGDSNNVCVGRPIGAACESDNQCGSGSCYIQSGHIGHCSGSMQYETIGSAPLCSHDEASICNDHIDGKVFITKTKCNGHIACLSGENLICANFLQPYVKYYWKGDAPLCNASETDCGDDHYVLSNNCGDGVVCTPFFHRTGNKVLCGVM